MPDSIRKAILTNIFLHGICLLHISAQVNPQIQVVKSDSFLSVFIQEEKAILEFPLFMPFLQVAQSEEKVKYKMASFHFKDKPSHHAENTKQIEVSQKPGV